MPFCSATANSELRNLTQHEPAGRAQVVGVPVGTGDQGRVRWWQLLPGDGAPGVWQGPAQPRGAVARRGCSVSVLCSSTQLQGLSVIPGLSTLRDLCSRSILAVSSQNPPGFLNGYVPKYCILSNELWAFPAVFK